MRGRRGAKGCSFESDPLSHSDQRSLKSEMQTDDSQVHLHSNRVLIVVIFESVEVVTEPGLTDGLERKSAAPL
jgi:hypothetical protein